MLKTLYQFVAISLIVSGLAGCAGYYGGDGRFNGSSSISYSSDDQPNYPRHHRHNDDGGFYGNTATGFVNNRSAHHSNNGGFSGSGS